MNRRVFLKTSAGLLATGVFGGCWSVSRPIAKKTKFSFRPYRPSETLGVVTCVTPDDGFYVHTYFDVCPFSPSQRYLAVTRVPYQERVPVLGETADVCVIDLKEQTIETVYTTKSWGFQTGANLNWGATDRHLYTNDVIGEQAVCVQIDLEADKAKAFAGPMYHIAPDESCVIGFPLELLDITQPGYGVPSKDPQNPRRLPPGAAVDQGIWKTDLKTNEKKLLVSLADVAAKIPQPPPRKDGTFYFWHSKFNKQGTRIMQVLRCLFPDGWGDRNVMVFTFAPDGSNIRYTPTTPVWGYGGGHPNWHPDGVYIIRNLQTDGKKTRFCRFRYDGIELIVLSEKIPGGGHPSIDPKGRYIITDSFSYDDVQKVHIRLVDLVSDDEQDICTVPTIARENLRDSVFRLDGHPVWSRDYKKVCFNAAPDGNRQVFIADLSNVI